MSLASAHPLEQGNIFAACSVWELEYRYWSIPMQRTAHLLGLTLIVVLAGWAVQRLQPTAADIAARHYGLVLVGQESPDLKAKTRPTGNAKFESTKILNSSIRSSYNATACYKSWRCSS